MIKYIIIGFIVLLMGALIAGMIMRRKHQSVVARLEQDKLQIQHYPIFEELTKLKSLNMNGQTEEMFEKWRNNWTEVIDVNILKVNSMLFDLEDYIDRFQFTKAKALEIDIEQNLQACEEKRLTILKELEELIGSEEKNRIEMEQLKDYYRSARKTVLAHQHSFGPALIQLEERLATFTPAFHEFDELTEQGNYLEAREIVLSLNEEAQQIYALLSDIPTALSDIQSKIPGMVHDLRNGQREMEEQSYYLNHLELTTYLDKVDQELTELKVRLANLELTYVKERVTEMTGELDKFYDLLEIEVHAKAYVDQNVDSIEAHLNEVLTLTKSVNEEVQAVQNSYRLSTEEVETPKNSLKQLEAIEKRFSVLRMRLGEEKSAYSSIQEELISILDEIEKVEEVQEKFSNSMKNLRIDEMNARTKLEQVKKQLMHAERKLNKANMPGIPDEMDARLEEAEEKLYVVTKNLEDVPLNIVQIQTNLGVAARSVDDVSKRIEEMIENVLLIEALIQFGNRYRATNEQVNVKLKDAENAFLQFRYVKALEDAAAAVEIIDGNAPARISALVQEQLTVKS